MRKYSRNKEHESSAAQPFYYSHPVSIAFSFKTKQTVTNSIFIMLQNRKLALSELSGIWRMTRYLIRQKAISFWVIDNATWITVAQIPSYQNTGRP